MATKKIAKARQSQLVTTYGVGSLFPAADQSFMIMGTDYWSEWSPKLEEPRLARALGVAYFRTPPAGRSSGDVPVTRFPLVHYCTKCHRLGRLHELAEDNTTDCRTCDLRLVPSRFVACCDAGHIEDFPYWAWVHSGREVTHGDHRMTLRSLGRSSSLADILVGCSCGVPARSMAGSFGKESLVQVHGCKGRRPWLPTDEDATCDRPLRTLQRGSSNVWFPSMRSTISIPPWSTAVSSFVDKHWAVLKSVPDDVMGAVVGPLVGAHPGISLAGVLAVIARKRGVFEAAPPTDAELRADEYRALCAGTGAATDSALDEFVCESRPVADELLELVAQVSSVGRLREVRALEGFSRVVPTVPNDERKPAALSESHSEWLPAVEVHGEGVFVRIREDVVQEWEATATAQERVRLLNDAQRIRDASLERPGSTPPVTGRFVALHSLAHVLLNEVSLHAGYPVASLRERLYASEGQTGILLYTASSDAAGSLGGLAALAATERFAEIFTTAIQRASWCSSDPVCAESTGSGAENLNLAACHACVVLPETSCEHRNVFLDRVSAIGSPIDKAAGLIGPSALTRGGGNLDAISATGN